MRFIPLFSLLFLSGCASPHHPWQLRGKSLYGHPSTNRLVYRLEPHIVRIAVVVAPVEIREVRKVRSENEDSIVGNLDILSKHGRPV